MPGDLKEILQEALKLPPEARAALAGTLLESLEELEEETAREVWDKEIQRRLTELDSGVSGAVPWSAARRRILGR
jgi:putative addiction module component (TIGR02574 family)